MTDPEYRKGLLLKSNTIAGTFCEEVRLGLENCGQRPKLVGILATTSIPSNFYAEMTRKQCEDIGVEFILKKTGTALSPNLAEGDGVEDAIIEANEDRSVHGIMVYFPIFGAQQDYYLQQIVSPLKDVEGLHFKFHYNLYHNIRFIEPSSLSSSATLTPLPTDGVLEVPPPGTFKSIIPCTPLAIVKCLEHIGVYNKILPYGDRVYGRTITIINRSEVVGRPLAALLSNDGARVFSIDIDSIQEFTKRPNNLSESNDNPIKRYHPRHVVHNCDLSLQECLAISDVVISAVPSAGYKVKTEWLKDGCICVNVASEKNFEKNVQDKASIYLPTIGKVTILMLLRNLLRLRQYQENVGQ